MPDFPTGIPDIADANASETLFTMHAGATHVTATNRILTNLRELATKIGIGASPPPGSAAVLRRTATGQSAWGQVQTGDIAASAITSALIADGTIVTGDIADGTIATADLAAGAVSQVGAWQAADGISTNQTSPVNMGTGATQVKVDLTTVAGSTLLCMMTIVTYSATVSAVANIWIKESTQPDVNGPYYGHPTANLGAVGVVFRVITGLSAGPHSIIGRWFTTGATVTATGSYALVVLELKK